MNDLLLAFCESPLLILSLSLSLSLLLPVCLQFTVFPKTRKKREAYGKCAAKEI